MNAAVVLLREWMGEGVDHSLATFSACVSRQARNKVYIDKNDPDQDNPLREVWRGALFLSMGTAVRLHETPYDKGLYQLEDKLMTLKTIIIEFIELSKARIKKKGKAEINKRCWLNKEEFNTHYTGYAAYSVKDNGCGTLTISDCCKSQIFYLDYYIVKSKKEDKENINRFYHEGVERLMKLVGFIDKSLAKIQDLRDQYVALPPFEFKPKPRKK